MRGRDIQRYGYTWANQYLIALFPALKYEIDDYPAVRDYLLSAEWSKEIPEGYGKLKLGQTGNEYEIQGLEFKARKKTSNKWFETQDPIDFWDDFSKQKLIWKRIGSILRFAYDEKGYLGLDSTCIATGSHAKFITAYLNSLLGNYLLGFSPKTGTGDLIVSVQAIESILMPKNASCMDTQTIEDIFSNTDYPRILARHTDRFDEQLFEHFGLSSMERRYIKEIVMQYRG